MRILQAPRVVLLPALLLVAFSVSSRAVSPGLVDPAGLGAALASALLFVSSMGMPVGKTLRTRLLMCTATLAAASALALPDAGPGLLEGVLAGLSLVLLAIFFAFARSVVLVEGSRPARILFVGMMALLVLDGSSPALIPGIDAQSGGLEGLFSPIGFDPVAVSLYLLAFANGFRSRWIHHMGVRGRWVSLACCAAVSALASAANPLSQAQVLSPSVVALLNKSLQTASILSGASALALLVSLPSAGAMIRRKKEIRALLDMGELILDGADRERVCRKAAESARDLSGGDASWVELLDPGGSSSIVSVSGTELIETGLPGCGLGSWLGEGAGSGKGRVLNGLPHGSPLDRLSSAGLRTRSLIVSPIRARGEDLGWLVSVSGNPFSFVDESAGLLDAFSGQVGVALLNSRLLLESVEKGRFQEEIEIARTVQMSIMSTSLPDIHPFEAAAFSRPSMEVGGDCFFLSAPECGTVSLFMADVAGKGAGAAILMSAVHATAVTLLREGYPPDTAAAALNRLLCAITPDDRFVTFFAARLDLASGVLTYSNAGHDPPILVRPGRGDAAVELTEGGLVLGIVEGASYESSTTVMERGDVLVLYTDGLTDRAGAAQADPRAWIAEVVSDRPGMAPGQLMERLVSGSEAEDGDLPDDDMTVLILKRSG